MVKVKSVTKTTEAMPNTLQGLVQAFSESFARLTEQTLKCCKIYAYAISNYPDAAEKFKEVCPGIPSGAWRRFELIGMGCMHPSLLTMEHPATKKLERLSFADQKQAIEGQIEVLTKDGDHCRVSIKDLPANLTDQVFANNHIRTLAEQKVWLENQSGGKFKPVSVGYKIVGGNRVQIKADTEFTKSDLLRILQEMK